jgi:hypothetical protein
VSSKATAGDFNLRNFSQIRETFFPLQIVYVMCFGKIRNLL